jgi:hypothetical protein
MYEHATWLSAGDPSVAQNVCPVEVLGGWVYVANWLGKGPERLRAQPFSQPANVDRVTDAPGLSDEDLPWDRLWPHQLPSLSLGRHEGLKSGSHLGRDQVQ